MWYNTSMQNKAENTHTDTTFSGWSGADKDTLLSVISQQESRIKVLEEALRLERTKRFGSSSEQSKASTRKSYLMKPSSYWPLSKKLYPLSPVQASPLKPKPVVNPLPMIYHASRFILTWMRPIKPVPSKPFIVKSKKSWISFRRKSGYWNTIRKKRSLPNRMRLKHPQ